LRRALSDSPEERNHCDKNRCDVPDECEEEAVHEG
jgi:hypothetical protein